eukprot:3890288-Rhodomonas_salina.2
MCGTEIGHGVTRCAVLSEGMVLRDVWVHGATRCAVLRLGMVLPGLLNGVPTDFLDKYERITVGVCGCLWVSVGVCVGLYVSVGVCGCLCGSADARRLRSIRRSKQTPLHRTSKLALNPQGTRHGLEQKECTVVLWGGSRMKEKKHSEEKARVWRRWSRGKEGKGDR